jgi:AraC-like DNA-binding protein
MLADRIAGHVKRELPGFADTLWAKLERISATKPSTRVYLLERLERARAFLHDNDKSPVGLARVSRVAGISEFHLSRLFTALYGESPTRYHRGLRLRKISAMLAGGSYTLDQAAEAFGYSDAASLSRALRRGDRKPVN